MANASPFNVENQTRKGKNKIGTGKTKKDNSASGIKSNVSGGNGSECGTSSTECGSDYSDQNSTTDDKPIVYNVSTSSIVVPNCKGKNSTIVGKSGVMGHNSRGAGKPKVNVVTP